MLEHFGEVCTGVVPFGTNVFPVSVYDPRNPGTAFPTCMDCPSIVSSVAGTKDRVWFAPNTNGLSSIPVLRGIGTTPVPIREPLGDGFSFKRIAIGSAALFGATATQLVRIGP
jgi:hypothetical protein